MGFGGFCWTPMGSTEFNWIVTEIRSVLKDFIRFNLISLDFSGLEWVILGFAWFY